jgi:5-methylcytosine-specific restriction endonuclease McrA
MEENYNTGSLAAFVKFYLQERGVDKMAKLTPEEIEQRIEEITRQIKYETYLSSKKWFAKRRAKLIEANYTCEKCGYNGLTNPIDIPLDAHHITYERFGDELMSDLKVLCRNCHQAQHGRAFVNQDASPASHSQPSTQYPKGRQS